MTSGNLHATISVMMKDGEVEKWAWHNADIDHVEAALATLARRPYAAAVMEATIPT